MSKTVRCPGARYRVRDGDKERLLCLCLHARRYGAVCKAHSNQETMRTDQLIALIKRHARFAYKEARDLERARFAKKAGETEEENKLRRHSAKYGRLRITALNKIIEEVDPYASK